MKRLFRGNQNTKNPKTVFQRFCEKYKIVESGCWEWQANLSQNGYGHLTVSKSKTLRAHRMSYVFFIGEITNNLHVLHKCDNRKCVNPFHLFLGTHQDNMDDARAKNRFNSIYNTIKHPSLSAYKRRGCRCKECIDIYRVYFNKRKDSFNKKRRDNRALSKKK